MSSNQRPDTLMQDRSYQFDENLLRRTAGPYIRVIRVGFVMSVVCPVYPCQINRSMQHKR